eukprot:CAMPEP_0117579996 /NCGR_PEP_ID=MMETSP0784-20121206/64942_1 /TAXON_ID=39447 /ORGANISM="" /LENGTH=53 /DNA_ID=CAMNT_0005379979 /DNA_START=1 /DNA_END=162 /DNA_ORIENTATION=-
MAATSGQGKRTESCNALPLELAGARASARLNQDKRHGCQTSVVTHVTPGSGVK